MEQPLTQHWQSEEGYYTVLLSPDLFGGWVLITASGKRGSRTGRVQHKPVESYAAGLESLRRVRQRRRREGYTLCGSGFMELSDLNPHSQENRNAEAEALFRMFQIWRLERAEQAALLDVTPKQLDAFRDSGALADAPELLRRSSHLLAIHKALRTLYAGDARRVGDWLHQPNPRFEAGSPLQLMLSGQEGLKVVRRYLEAEADMQVCCPMISPGSKAETTLQDSVADTPASGSRQA